MSMKHIVVLSMTITFMFFGILGTCCQDGSCGGTYTLNIPWPLSYIAFAIYPRKNRTFPVPFWLFAIYTLWWIFRWWRCVEVHWSLWVGIRFSINMFGYHHESGRRRVNGPQPDPGGQRKGGCRLLNGHSLWRLYDAHLLSHAVILSLTPSICPSHTPFYSAFWRNTPSLDLCGHRWPTLYSIYPLTLCIDLHCRCIVGGGFEVIVIGPLLTAVVCLLPLFCNFQPLIVLSMQRTSFSSFFFSLYFLICSVMSVCKMNGNWFV